MFKTPFGYTAKIVFQLGKDTENTDNSPDVDFYGPLVNQSE
jgi:hypothetical protein